MQPSCSHDHHHHHDHGIETCTAVTPATLIAAHGVGVEKGGRTLLERVSLTVEAREIVTLIGPNGAGKTTLVRVLLGLEPPTSGHVHRKGGLVVGYVPQRFDIEPAIPLTVADFVTMGQKADPIRLAKTLTEVGADHISDRQLARLSGGELQRAILARALYRNPSLLVLDEPSRGVDHLGEADLYALISRLRAERGFGVLLVSHDLHIVMANADRVICLNRHVCCSGHPETVAQHPEYTRLFGPEAAAFGLYTHHHDHDHDISGAPVRRSPADKKAPT